VFDETMIVPSVALIPDDGEYKVMVYQNGTVHESFVETGIRLSDRIQIMSGIAPGDTVLVNGLMQVSEGSEVEIRNLNQITDYEPDIKFKYPKTRLCNGDVHCDCHLRNYRL